MEGACVIFQIRQVYSWLIRRNIMISSTIFPEHCPVGSLNIKQKSVIFSDLFKEYKNPMDHKSRKARLITAGLITSSK